MSSAQTVIIPDTIPGYVWRCYPSQRMKEHVRESDGKVMASKTMSAADFLAIKKRPALNLDDEETEPSKPAKPGGNFRPSTIKPGDRFEMLTVKRELAERGPAGQRIYLCVCDCGKEAQTGGSELTSGRKWNCGCKRRARRESIETAIRPKAAPAKKRQKRVVKAEPAPEPTTAREMTTVEQVETIAPVTSAPRDLRTCASQIEGLTKIVLGLAVAEIEAMRSELVRVEAQTPSFLIEGERIASLRALVEEWLKFRTALEAL